MRCLQKLAWVLIYLSAGSVAFAQNAELETTVSGFGNVTAGKVLNGTYNAQAELDWDCPCYVTDLAQNGVYQRRRWQFKPDSKVGIQGRVATADHRYSITAQAVSRGAANGKVNLEWFYGAAQLNPHWTVQVGRQRLPLLMNSDVQDVSYSIPSIHLAQQLYGWEIVNFDGGAVRYQAEVKGSTLSAHLFAGSETNQNSGFWKYYNGKNSKTASRWSGMTGGVIKVEKGWFTARAALMQSKTQNKQIGIDQSFSQSAKQKIGTLGLTADFGGPFFNAEFLTIDRREDYGGDGAQQYSAGYRLGKYTSVVTYANYRQRILDTLPFAPEAHRALSGSVRYDVNAWSSVKVQYDLRKDKSDARYSGVRGNANLFSLSYDWVF
jgi:hypothetical protein